ncbi:hypothetical protein X943_002684 [Babesia divergens]|uniref:Spindle pole body component n=1 Tax=Babesia divergens TaxID=32595 RepID=A0AAD9LI56_BABDI|nr:hypothetical protein X943_002684 [Babesia divergens]
MLHDILMALVGHPGDVIVERSGTKAGFAVSEACHGISQAERKIINSVVKIGYKYRCLEEFVRRIGEEEYNCVVSSVLNQSVVENLNRTAHLRSHRSRTKESSTIGDAGNPRGFYVSALCSGIEEYLESYRSTLVTVEKVVLADPVLPLSTLSLLLTEHKETLDGLIHIVDSYTTLLARKQAEDGCTSIRADEVLAMLQDTTCNDNIKAIYNKLYNKCLATFQMQLKAWICQGQLVDSHNEFMIGRRQLVSDESGETLAVQGHRAFVFEHLHEELNSEASEFEWNYMFFIRAKQSRWVQCSYQTWKDILFLGKAARMLLRRYHNEKELESRASHIFNEWQVVCASPNSFEQAIAQYRAWVAQAFWVYINENFNVQAHLDLFRQIYMLGYHNLYTELLESSWFTMQTPCNLTACTNLKPTFWKVMANRVNIKQLTSHTPDSTNGDDVEMIGTNQTAAARTHGTPFQLRDSDLIGGSYMVSAFFDYRQRTSYFNMDQRRFVLCGNTAWIDNDLVLNVSEKRLETPLSNVVDSAAAWFENMVHVTDGFETCLQLELCQLQTANTCNEGKMRGNSLGRFARFAMVTQSRIEPTRLDFAYEARNPWDLLKDSFAIEFVVQCGTGGERNTDIFIDGSILVGGKCAFAVCGDPKTGSTRNKVLRINKAEQAFRASTARRHDFVFSLKFKMSLEHIFAELKHLNSGNSLILETDVIDATQTLHHDFGDAYIGIVSSPFETLNASSKIDVSKKNSAVRVSRWDFAGSVSKYDMLPLGDKETQLGQESFQNELPDLKTVKFESGLNDWMYSTLAYRCSWPISILLDLPTMLCYNSIFQFMFLLRRCTYGLEMLCHIHPRMRRLGSENRVSPLPDICRRASCIRWRMYLFMTSILSYIQQCVVEKHYVKLRNCATQSESFQVIKAAHDQYLENIAVNCFLDEDAVIQPLLRCMDVSMKFATLYYAAFNGTSGIDAGLIMRRLNEFNEIFELNMVRIATRLLFLSNKSKYSTLNILTEVCSFMRDL